MSSNSQFLAHAPARRTNQHRPRRLMALQSKKAIVTLKWNTAACATAYEIVIRRGKPDGRIVEEAKGLTVTQFKTIPLAAGKTYYWHVRACNGVVCGKWSARQSFSLQGETKPTEK